MSKREKGILIVMALAVLYGGYSLLAPSTEPTPPEATTQSLQDVEGFVLGVIAELPRFSLNKTEEYMIAAATAPWGGNPFLKVTLEENNIPDKLSATVPEPKVPLVYSGFIELGDRRLAILNNREYEPGDALEISGYSLLAVYPSHVELKWLDSDDVRVIPLEEFVRREDNLNPPKK
ncbi:hypothetical protein D3OALGA1CA_3673 [Olavius algarvensis associated proteobacterium Delta 3]|nr:hypothetical protein D3OALGA1CA_3673 [Olavius algarvensis associated proteobacterium Delta 3]CAB5148111.1 hypothetical protein D3OALGB2SA_4634 [Olavius algarvensis associated proteobacterium Delta 3]